MRTITKQRGFTLVETLFYAAGVVILIGAMVGFLFYMYDWYRNVTVGPRMDRVGSNLVQHIVRDLRGSQTLNSSSSVFGNATGTISITTNSSNGSVTKYITLNSNRRIEYKEGSGSYSSLSPADVVVTRFYVNKIETSVSAGVRFDIDITYKIRNQATTTKTYTGLAILKQSYE